MVVLPQPCLIHGFHLMYFSPISFGISFVPSLIPSSLGSLAGSFVCIVCYCSASPLDILTFCVHIAMHRRAESADGWCGDRGERNYFNLYDPYVRVYFTDLTEQWLCVDSSTVLDIPYTLKTNVIYSFPIKGMQSLEINHTEHPVAIDECEPFYWFTPFSE